MIRQGKKTLGAYQVISRLSSRDGSVSFQAHFKPVKGVEYMLTANVGDIHGQHQTRTIALVPPS